MGFQHVGGSGADGHGGVLEPACTAGEGRFCASVPNSTMIGGLKSTVARVCTPHKSANTTDLGLFTPLEELFVNIYHTLLWVEGEIIQRKQIQ